MSASRAQGGFTAAEVMVVLAILSLTFTAFAGVFSASDGLVKHGRLNHRAYEDLRRSLEAVANVLRDADIDTLSGLDADGRSTAPSFQRVTGADAAGRTYGETETLRWQAATRPVDGIAEPGQVVHVRGGVVTLVADRVPRGGFDVVLDGNTLVVSLTTYASLDIGRTVSVSGDTAVSLRN